MEWWDKLMFPMRRVWISIAIRLGIRNKGLSKLKHDVRRCEYEDVHVMWEMLRRTESDIAFASTTTTTTAGPGSNNSSPTSSSSSRSMNKNHHHHQKRPILKMFVWARRAPYLCRSF